MFLKATSSIVKQIVVLCQDGGLFPLFQIDWTAEEELLLLVGVEDHGFGNWLVSLSSSSNFDPGLSLD